MTADVAGFVYEATCPVICKVSESRNGAGYESPFDGLATDYVDEDRVIAALRERAVFVGSADLHRHTRAIRLERIEVAFDAPDLATFRFHSSVPLSPTELRAIRDDFAGQLSDGWGEVFEQANLLTADASAEFDDEDVRVGLAFSFERHRLTTPSSVSATRMEALTTSRLRMR